MTIGVGKKKENIFGIKDEEKILEMPLFQCDISRDIVKTLNKEGMVIVRDICVRPVDEIRDIIDESDWDILSKSIEKFGLCFRSKEDDLLYGYPTYVRNIAEKKGEYWEYRLFAELMILNYEWLNKLRKEVCITKQKEYYKTSPYGHTNKSIKDYIIRKLDDLKEITDILFENWQYEIRAGYGIKTEECSVRKIYNAVEEFMLTYRMVICWMKFFSNERAIGVYYYRILMELHGIADGLLDFYDCVYDELIDARNTLKEYIYGDISSEDGGFRLSIYTNTNLDVLKGDIEDIRDALPDEEGDSDFYRFDGIRVLSRNNLINMDIDFRGLTFSQFLKSIKIILWENNNSKKTYSIDIHDLEVDGKSAYTYDPCEIEPGRCGFFDLEICNAFWGSYQEIRDIAFSVEICDEKRNEIAYSQKVYIKHDEIENSYYVYKIEIDN